MPTPRVPIVAVTEPVWHVEDWTQFETSRPQRGWPLEKLVRWGTMLIAAVLALILVGFLATNVFFFFSKSWIVPTPGAGEATVTAAVPDRNLDDVQVGSAVHACRLQMIWCRRVGTVVEIRRDAITLEHPYRNQRLRGRVLALRLEDPSAADASVLFIGGAPLWL